MASTPPSPFNGAQPSPEAALVPYSGGMAPALASSGGKAASSPIRRYLVFLLRKWWIILLSVLFFGGLAAAYVAWWPQSYMAAAHMWAAGRMGMRSRLWSRP